MCTCPAAPAGPDTDARYRHADQVQALRFLDILDQEFEVISARIRFAEQCADLERRHGFPSCAQHFEKEARCLCATLGEVRDMMINLRALRDRDGRHTDPEDDPTRRSVASDAVLHRSALRLPSRSITMPTQ